MNYEWEQLRLEEIGEIYFSMDRQILTQTKFRQPNTNVENRMSD
jgi:hypothetical protein